MLRYLLSQICFLDKITHLQTVLSSLFVAFVSISLTEGFEDFVLHTSLSKMNSPFIIIPSVFFLNVETHASENRQKTRKISVVNRFECWLRKRILTKLSIHASLFALSKIPGFWGTDRTSLIKKICGSRHRLFDIMSFDKNRSIGIKHSYS